MEKIKQKTNKFTLASLAVGAIIIPLQPSVSNTNLDNSTETGHAKVHSEHHPHSTEHGTWQNHYVDPRSLRAVGNDNGKDSENEDSQDPWRMYNARAA